MLRAHRTLAAALAAALLAGAPPAAAATGAEALAEAGILKLVSGGYHSCALTTSRRVFCWGANGNGQLGDGSNVSRLEPVEITALGGGVREIALGAANSCAITAGGHAFCWGRGSEGQIGDGANTDRWSPTAVQGLGDDVRAIAVGLYFACALNRVGRAFCWGSNGWGQLGDGTNASRNLPVLVSGIAAATAIVAGTDHTCALDVDRKALCWGRNHHGQLGDGTFTSRSLRAPVANLGGGLREFVAGLDFTCAVTRLRRLMCWGGNGRGQLGDGTGTDSPLPVRVKRIGLGAHGVAAGGAPDDAKHACALNSGGRLFCWGSNIWGELGDRTFTDRWLPRRVVRFRDGMQMAAAGATHSCAVTAGGRPYCWGDNSFGQLGDGTNASRPVPAEVSGDLHLQE